MCPPVFYTHFFQSTPKTFPAFLLTFLVVGSNPIAATFLLSLVETDVYEIDEIESFLF